MPKKKKNRHEPRKDSMQNGLIVQSFIGPPELDECFVSSSAWKKVATDGRQNTRRHMTGGIRRLHLVGQYGNALIENGYGMPYAELEAKDQIDMRTVKAPEKQNDAWTPDTPLYESTNYQTYRTTGNLFHKILPCFKEAVIRINNGRYIHFKVKDVDMDKKTIWIFLQDYIVFPNGLLPGISATMQFVCQDGTYRYAPTSEPQTYPQIYRKLSFETVFDSKSDITFWKQNVIFCADLVMKSLIAANISCIAELARLFLNCIIVMNYFLETNRPKRKPAPGQKPVVKQTIAAENGDGHDIPEQPERIARTVRMIEFLSQKPPRRVKERAPSVYKVSSWKTRGHVRHLKSGKTVWIDETVHHRRSIRQDGTVPQSVISIKSKEQEEQSA